jgi:uncharacterized protein
MDVLIVAIASFFAGCVDAIVGGGGLILVPALFAIYPQASPATLLGTNKSAAIWGTIFSFAQFARRVELRWRALAWGLGAALIGSALGAWAATVLPAKPLRLALPLVLLAVLIYTLAKKDLGRVHKPRFEGRAEAAAMATLAVGIGFYDGVFGPGAGSFFVFLLVRWLGYDFLNASASAKLLNIATNAAALALFTWKGHVWWHVGAVLAVANVAGSLIGTRLALKHGAGFVRAVFIVVVSALIAKTGYDALQLMQ